MTYEMHVEDRAPTTYLRASMLRFYPLVEVDRQPRY